MKNKQKFILVTHQFGEPIYIAPTPFGEPISITDTPKEAEIWSLEDTLSSCKLPYYKAVTGYNELTFQEL